MGSVSRFENCHVQIREKVETLIFDLRYLVQLLEANIEAEEEHTGVADPGTRTILCWHGSIEPDGTI